MIEIRWHGRGGQGGVTAAKVLAATALRDGKQFQAFPEYGPERRGAPVQAFTRISDQPIRTFSHVTNPNIVVVLDSSLIGKVPLAEGLDEDGVLIANYDGTPAELRERLSIRGRKVFTVNATDIANRTLGRPITNTTMLGALVRATGVVSLEELLAEVREMFSKFKGDIVEKNLAAVKAAYEEVRSE